MKREEIRNIVEQALLNDDETWKLAEQFTGQSWKNTVIDIVEDAYWAFLQCGGSLNITVKEYLKKRIEQDNETF